MSYTTTRLSQELGVKMKYHFDSQPLQGMTVNERLVHLHLDEDFDRSAAARDAAAMVSGLERAQFSSKQAEETAQAILADPARYGY